VSLSVFLAGGYFYRETILEKERRPLAPVPAAKRNRDGGGAGDASDPFACCFIRVRPKEGSLLFTFYGSCQTETLWTTVDAIIAMPL
jgi:hypothetical protein